MSVQFYEYCGDEYGDEMVSDKRLSASFVKNITEAGKYFDGGGLGLCLRVDARGYKRWVQRIRICGRQRDLGLGSPPVISLAAARERALENKRMVLAGENPIVERKLFSAKLLFKDAANQAFQKKKYEFRSEKHAKQWMSAINTYAMPRLENIPVDEISLKDILAVLEPIWITKNQTAKRIQQRLEFILNWSKVTGHRSGENPAQWRGNLSELLANPNKLRNTAHHPALQSSDARRWWLALSTLDGMGATALKILALTACRSGDVRGMRWSEIKNGSESVWIIPAERAKTEVDYRIPLTDEMIKLLDCIQKSAHSDLVFHSPKFTKLSDMTLSAAMRRMHKKDEVNNGLGFVDATSGKPAVPHGLRSTFRDWAAECGYDSNLAEIQLCHAVGTETQRAYLRTDMVQRRRQMMVEYGKIFTG